MANKRLILAVSGVLLGIVSACAAPPTPPTMTARPTSTSSVQVVATATRTMLADGELIHIPLENTLPDDFEDAPRLTAVLTITDSFTGQPVAADVFLYRKYPNTGSVTAVDILPLIPCEAAHVCNLELAAFDDGKIWMVQVRADGYEDWIVELNFEMNSSKVLTLPVRLIKGGGVTG